ncbi:alpha/beta hydrolase [Dothidotthia symphoricarpi CBS 119687]|uniref:Alpha/beta hydrolase n=1 Tax=Dothidotthia symphoricarpi CBS 119687 TaxID=1392245 RepID=A0A6A6AKZ4_9PLEO|nr:alpha/beta hydrolase [Dothidotthia symphoricarpi CBS 119687]KAF2132470.1 alpha/beta hydrolase [Dothidotthia symphoricarpi CBS 119687]
MYEFFKGAEFFNFELTRILSASPYGGCDVAEFLDALDTIKPNHAQSWQQAWTKQAEKVERLANDALSTGHTKLARGAFLRASNYFRASQYMLFERELSLRILERSIANFQLAMGMFDYPVESVEIAHDGLMLPGMLYLPNQKQRVSEKVPLIIVCGGADSTKEELHFLIGASGPSNGYAMLLFDGPGQGISLLRDKTVQRPDWEAVIESVLDYIVAFADAHPSVALDMDRIAITGASMGGYYALRGATDIRIKACVAIDAFYDLFDLVMVRQPKMFMALWLGGWIPDRVIDTLTQLQGRLDFQSKWEVWCSSTILGTEKPSDLMRKTKEFTLRLPDGSELLDAVTCPVLVSGAAHSLYFKPELSCGKIVECLHNIEECKKEVWVPEEPADGGLQAKVGAWALMQYRTFKFLDKHFDIDRCEVSR